MGYELWSSPITGYRRHGTRLSEIRSLFEKGITSYTILEPLKSCYINSPVSEIKTIMNKLDFDVMGVKSSKESEVIGYVKKKELSEGIIKKYVHRFTKDDLISDSTSLADIIKIFHNRDYIFVLVGQFVNGIITKADINKPPIRIYLFSLISLFEMHLSYWIRKKLEENSWKDLLESNRLKRAKNIYKRRKENNQDIDLLDCLEFRDKIDILFSSREILDIFQIKILTSDKKKIIKQLEKLRNNLAHSHSDIALGIEWNDLVQSIDLIEYLIGISDSQIENDLYTASSDRDVLI